MSWTLIEHQSLSSSAASVTLGSGGTIPQTYKSLKLLITARSDRAGGNTWSDLQVQLNGSASNLTARRVYGTGSGTGSDTSAWINFNASGSTASTFSSFEIGLPDYAGSTNKPYSIDAVAENNATAGYQTLAAWLVSNTAAITSIKLADLNANFVSGSTFTLYGLA